MPDERTSAPTVSDHEAQQLGRANDSGEQPVVFVHGLWLAHSWEPSTPRSQEGATR